MIRATRSSAFALGALVLATAAATTQASPPAQAPGQVRQMIAPGRLPDHVLSLAFGEESLWLSCHTGGPIWRRQEARTYRINPRTLETLASFPVSGLVAVGEGAVWVRHYPPRAGLLSKIDPRTTRVVATLALKHGEGERMVAGEGAVWLSGRHEFAPGSHVVRIDPQAFRVVAAIPLDRPVADLAVGEGALWVLSGGWGNREVLRLDPRTNQVVARIPVSSQTCQIAAGEGWVWTVAEGSGLVGRPAVAVARINPATNREEGSPRTLARQAGINRPALAAGLGGLWVTEFTDRDKQAYTVSFIDARTGRAREYPISTSHRVLVAIALGDQAVWAASWSATGGSVLDRLRPWSGQRPLGNGAAPGAPPPRRRGSSPSGAVGEGGALSPP